MDLFAASTLLVNALTARLALDALAVLAGGVIAVTGAAASSGGYVVQLARADGLRVVADAAAADEHLVRELVADDVVRRGDDVAERARALVPDGVDGLADGAPSGRGGRRDAARRPGAAGRAGRRGAPAAGRRRRARPARPGLLLLSGPRRHDGRGAAVPGRWGPAAGEAAARCLSAASEREPGRAVKTTTD